MRALALGIGLVALAGCAADAPERAPEEMRPIEPVPANAPAPVTAWPAAAIAGPAASPPPADLRPIPPGPEADAAMDAAAAAMVMPPPAARTNCVADFATRFRLPRTAVLMGGQGRTAAGWYIDLGMPGNARTWRCQTGPEGAVRTVTPR
ncbi:hypothetical protein SAMN05444722_1304 [Rhodovulum sp. ES.010]|uniref:hypothetical protein n=1 Tax=Rhodovulum sp. ES.010 TaxID=1882821 RepID=UPI0009288BA1|nr:hypothetical protein [Rhodovulum sp. ES.010]SIO30156.1 hypothetical protein SAMN05444722_1304 [Rhodovulum sp. ES.010]